MAARFHFRQQGLRARDHRSRQTGKTRHMHAVGAIRRTVDDLVQEDDLAFPFPHFHRVAGQPVQIFAKRGEFVIMGGEQGAAAIHRMQMLERGPGDRQPVIGRRAAADLVEDYKGFLGGAVQDRGRLDHLDHEGGTPARQVVGRADTAEQPVDHADDGGFRRNEKPGLCHHGNMGVLTQKGRFAGHVWTGDKPDVARFAEMAVIRNEALAGGEHGLDHGMAATGDLETAVVADLGPAELPPRRQRRRRQRHIDGGQSPRRRRQPVGRLQDRCAQTVENLQLAGEGPVGGRRQVAFEFSKLGRGEPHSLRRCLAVDELFVLHQLFGMRVAHIDMIAEDIVVLDLERGNAGRLAIALLEGRDQPPAFVTQPAQLVQRGIKATAYKPAVPCQQRRIIGQRRRQLCCQRGRRHHRGVQAVKLDGPVNADIARGGPDHVRSGAKRLCQRQQVARPAMPHRQSRQCAIDIGKPLEHGPQIVTQIRPSQIPGHQIQPAVDQLRVRQRRADPRGEKTATGRRHRHVDRRQQAATGLAGQGAAEFKRAPGGLVDFHIAGPGNSLERAHARHVALLRQVDIAEQGAGGRQHGAAELAETVEAGNPVIAAQRALPGR